MQFFCIYHIISRFLFSYLDNYKEDAVKRINYKEDVHSFPNPKVLKMFNVMAFLSFKMKI